MSKRRGSGSSPSHDARSPARRQADYVLGRMVGAGSFQSFAVFHAKITDGLLTHVFEAPVSRDGEVPDFDQVIQADLVEKTLNFPPLEGVVVVCTGFFVKAGVSRPGVLTVESRGHWWDAPVVRWLVGDALGPEEPYGERTLLRRPLPPPRDRWA